MFKLAVLLTVVACVAYSQSPPPPPFLEGAPDSVIEDFHKLMAKSGSKTDTEIDAAVEEWVGKQSDSIKSKYEDFKKNRSSQQDEAKKAHADAVEKFSKEAKEADAKLTAIADNPKLTAQEKSQQIQKIIGDLPEGVKKEIEESMKG